MSRTRVLVNLTWLVPGVVGGSEESVTDALRAVSAERDDIDLTLAVLEGFAAAHPDLATRARCLVNRMTGANKVRRVVSEQTWLARRIREERPDVVHHAGGTVPLVHPGRIVLTIHDVQPLDIPENFRADKRLYMAAMLGRSARAAEVVHVPSEFSRDRVVERLGIGADRVVVVPWFVRRSPPPDPRVSAEAAQGLANRIGRRRFVLYPAITYPHKQHLALLDAFAQVAAVDDDVVLVLTGGPGPGEDAVARRAARSDLAGRVVRTGRVPSQHLDAWYRSAAAVVFPSAYEGFGLPVLEAMTRGAPVVVSDAGALPEVARPQDVVPVGDVTAWASAMQAVLDLDDRGRAERIRSGRAVADAFSPQRTAAGLADIYRRVAAAAPSDTTR